MTDHSETLTVLEALALLVLVLVGFIIAAAFFRPEPRDGL